MLGSLIAFLWSAAEYLPLFARRTALYQSKRLPVK